MAYTTIDNPELYFQTKLFSGTGGGGGSLTFDGSENMQPDMVWSKSRTEALNHTLFDSVRTAGSNKELTPNGTSPEGGSSSAGFGYISAFNSNGFTWTAGSTNTENFNKSSQTYVHWNWKAGTSFTNDASATSVGTIDSSGSVNTDAGFSIVSYTNTDQTANSGVATIKHGLNTTPNVIILKDRDATSDWQVFHSSLPTNKYLDLNTTDAAAVDTNVWNNTAPTSSVFTVGDNSYVNPSNRAMIAYCFAEKQGYSKFGSYTGNGNADGPFVYTGFKPAWLLIRNTTSGSENWAIYDNKRDSFNTVFNASFPNRPNADGTNTSQNLDFLSNGFKLKSAEGRFNASGNTMIFMAFAESPFVTSTGIPTTSR